MTKSTITREQLLEIIETDHVQCGEASYLARMALAALDNEPVAWRWRRGPDTRWHLASSGDLAGEVEPLYRHAQTAPMEQENLALQNYRAAMEGICHIRRTLEETFGGLHGTHVEPDVLMDCKSICDAIYAAYRGNTSVVPEVLQNLRTIVADPRRLPRRKEWIGGQQYSYVLLEEVEALVEDACRAAPEEVKGE